MEEIHKLLDLLTAFDLTHSHAFRICCIYILDTAAIHAPLVRLDTFVDIHSLGNPPVKGTGKKFAPFHYL